MAEPVVELHDVSFGYPPDGLARPVIEGVSMRVEHDDCLGVIGPNGGGKTTLVKIMLGLLRPQRGTVRVLGRSPRDVRHRIGYVPQHRAFDAHSPANVMDVVLMGRLHGSRWGMRYGAAHRAAAREAMSRAGVEDLADRPIATLSGGQRQRALIARALASDAAMLILDEPMAGVDEPMQAGLSTLMRELNRDLPIVIVSHDVAFVAAEMKHIACVNRHVDVHAAADVSSEVVAAMYHGPVRAVAHHSHAPDDAARQRDEDDT